MADPQPSPLGGMSLDEFLAPREGETSRAIPEPPGPPKPYTSPSGRTPGWRGYAEAATVGAAGAAPFAALEAAVPGFGWGPAALTLGSGAVGGMVEHAIKQNAPPGTPEWVAPAAGFLVAPWARGGQAMVQGIMRHPRDYAIGGGLLHYFSGGLPNIFDISSHIYKSAMAAAGMPLLYGVPQAIKKTIQGDVRPLVESYGGAVGAEANRLFNKYVPADPSTLLPDFSPLYNLLNPPPQPPAAEAAIPIRPPDQRPQLPRTGTRLQMD